MFVNRVLQQAGNTFVESQQDATRGSSSLQHRSVFCPRESLLNDAIGVVPKPPLISGLLSRNSCQATMIFIVSACASPTKWNLSVNGRPGRLAWPPSRTLEDNPIAEPSTYSPPDSGCSVSSPIRSTPAWCATSITSATY